MNIAFVVFAYSTLFLLGFIDNSRSPIYPILLQEFGVTKSLGSLIFSLSSLGAFFISLYAHKWLSRFDIIAATRGALIFDFISCLLMGLSVGGRLGFYQFVFASIIFGLSTGIKGITLNIIIDKKGPLKYRRQLFAGLHSMYGIASFFAPVILGTFFIDKGNWRDYFLMISILPLGVFLYSFKVSAIKYNEKSKDDKSINSKAVYVVGSMFALYVSSEILLSSRLTSYLSEVHGMDISMASLYLSSFFVALLGGRVLIGIFNFTYSSFELIRLSLISSLIFSLVGIIYYPPVLALNGLSMSIFFPCGLDWISSRFAGNTDYVLSKVAMIVGGFLVGMHFLYGNLSDAIGLSLSIWILPIFLSISLYLLQFWARKLTI